MISDRPDRYVRWVAAVKAGNDWSDSLRNDFGVSRDQLVQTAVRFYMVND
jgi:hypothetical protein